VKTAPAACDPEPVRTPAASDTWAVQDLGTIQVGQVVTFDVPAGTGSFLIMQQAAGTPAGDVVWGSIVPNSVVPTNLRDPNDVLYWDDLHAPNADPSLLAFSPGWQPATGTFGIPNTSQGLTIASAQLPPGTWSFTANDWAAECLQVPGCTGGSAQSSYRYHVVTKPTPSGTSTLDVEVYLATDPANPVTAVSSAANAAQSAGVARWRSTLAQLLARLGITLGTVTFHDLPAADRAKYAPGGSVDVSDGSPCGNLSQLFTTSTVRSRAIQLFLADELVDSTSGGGFTTIGVDGAIPGPSGFSGTVLSGAIVGVQDEMGHETSAGACSGAAMSLSGCGSDLMAYIAAHEIGHWLGLFHTTESAGANFDPVADTTTCPCSTCAPAGAPRNACSSSSSPTHMLGSWCSGLSSCGGGRNLMFWLYSASSTGEVSDQQGQIARRSPVVQ
jgi:hypothetical protein